MANGERPQKGGSDVVYPDDQQDQHTTTSRAFGPQPQVAQADECLPNVSDGSREPGGESGVPAAAPSLVPLANERPKQLTITLPLTTEQATAVVVAADRWGVEPWEMGAHVLQARRWF